MTKPETIEALEAALREAPPNSLVEVDPDLLGRYVDKTRKAATDDTLITPSAVEAADPQGYGPGGRLAEALARAQGEIRNPGKSSENPHFRAKYANLAEGIAVIRGPLSKHGVAWVQSTSVEGDVLILTTSLIHAVSGETLDARWPVGAYAKLTPQQMGSSLTYGKRYTLFSLVGIAGADEDDDGAAAAGPVREETIDLDQRIFIEQQLRDTESDTGKFLTALGASSLADLTLSQYQRGLALLEEKKRRFARTGEPQ